jgi:hypothetical protein
MPDEDARPRPFAAPFAPERREVGQPLREIVDVAGRRVRAQPAGARLAAPVERGDVPAAPMPVIERLEILLVGVATAGQEQQAAARIPPGSRPVDPADRVAVGRRPETFAGIGGYGAAIEGRRSPLDSLANSNLLPVVTF